MTWRLGRRVVGVGVVLVCVAVRAQGRLGQAPGLPTLTEVMDRLQANYVEYVSSVPNLFCDEKVLSEYGFFTSTSKSTRTLTESVFRLQRRLNEKKQPTLAESRQVRRVDGKAADKEQLSGPSILYGVFGTSMGFVSREQQSCVEFRLRPAKPRLGREEIEVELKPLRAGERDDKVCGERKWKGKVFIDRETMHIARIEMKTSGYEIVKGVHGDWDWQADYAPVMLVGRPFWLPVTIRSDAVSYADRPEEWTFTADYRNYHKMAASGRIVPGTVEELPGAEGQASPQ